MKTTKKVLAILSVIVIVVLTLVPLIFWFQNPEYTRMQILIKYWVNYAVIVAVYFVYVFILNKDK